MSIWKKMNRSGSKAVKFKFTITYHEMVLEYESKCVPDKVCLIWSHKNRKILAAWRKWEPSIENAYKGVIHWPVPESTEFDVTLFRDSKNPQIFQDLYWNLLVSDLTTKSTKNNGKTSLKNSISAKTAINFKEFIGPSCGLESKTTPHLKLDLKPKEKFKGGQPKKRHIKQAYVDLSITTQFISEGKTLNNEHITNTNSLDLDFDTQQNQNYSSISELFDNPYNSNIEKINKIQHFNPKNSFETPLNSGKNVFTNNPFDSHYNLQNIETNYNYNGNKKIPLLKNFETNPNNITNSQDLLLEMSSPLLETQIPVYKSKHNKSKKISTNLFSRCVLLTSTSKNSPLNFSKSNKNDYFNTNCQRNNFECLQKINSPPPQTLRRNGTTIFRSFRDFNAKIHRSIRLKRTSPSNNNNNSNSIDFQNNNVNIQTNDSLKTFKSFKTTPSNVMKLELQNLTLSSPNKVIENKDNSTGIVENYKGGLNIFVRRLSLSSFRKKKRNKSPANVKLNINDNCTRQNAVNDSKKRLESLSMEKSIALTDPTQMVGNNPIDNNPQTNIRHSTTQMLKSPAHDMLQWCANLLLLNQPPNKDHLELFNFNKDSTQSYCNKNKNIFKYLDDIYQKFLHDPASVWENGGPSSTNQRLSFHHATDEHVTKSADRDDDNNSITNYYGHGGLDIFRDGRIFASLINIYAPHTINMKYLTPLNITDNCKLVFSAAHSIGIPALLEPTDLLQVGPLNKLAIITYLYTLKTFLEKRRRKSTLNQSKPLEENASSSDIPSFTVKTTKPPLKEGINPNVETLVCESLAYLNQEHVNTTIKSPPAQTFSVKNDATWVEFPVITEMPKPIRAFSSQLNLAASENGNVNENESDILEITGDKTEPKSNINSLTGSFMGGENQKPVTLANELKNDINNSFASLRSTLPYNSLRAYKESRLSHDKSSLHAMPQYKCKKPNINNNNSVPYFTTILTPREQELKLKAARLIQEARSKALKSHKQEEKSILQNSIVLNSPKKSIEKFESFENKNEIFNQKNKLNSTPKSELINDKEGENAIPASDKAAHLNQDDNSSSSTAAPFPIKFYQSFRLKVRPDFDYQYTDSHVELNCCDIEPGAKIIAQPEEMLMSNANNSNNNKNFKDFKTKTPKREKSVMLTSTPYKTENPGPYNNYKDFSNDQTGTTLYETPRANLSQEKSSPKNSKFAISNNNNFENNVNRNKSIQPFSALVEKFDGEQSPVVMNDSTLLLLDDTFKLNTSLNQNANDKTTSSLSPTCQDQFVISTDSNSHDNKNINYSCHNEILNVNSTQTTDLYNSNKSEKNIELNNLPENAVGNFDSVVNNKLEKNKIKSSMSTSIDSIEDTTHMLDRINEIIESSVLRSQLQQQEQEQPFLNQTNKHIKQLENELFFSRKLETMENKSSINTNYDESFAIMKEKRKIIQHNRSQSHGGVIEMAQMVTSIHANDKCPSKASTLQNGKFVTDDSTCEKRGLTKSESTSSTNTIDVEERRLEQRYDELKADLQAIMQIPENEKTAEILAKEHALMDQLVEVVDLRDKLVQLHEDFGDSLINKRSINFSDIPGHTGSNTLNNGMTTFMKSSKNMFYNSLPRPLAKRIGEQILSSSILQYPRGSFFSENNGKHTSYTNIDEKKKNSRLKENITTTTVLHNNHGQTFGTNIAQLLQDLQNDSTDVPHSLNWQDDSSTATQKDFKNQNQPYLTSQRGSRPSITPNHFNMLGGDGKETENSLSLGNGGTTTLPANLTNFFKRGLEGFI